MTGTGEAVLFWIAGPLMVLGALGLAFSRRAIYAALSMVMTMILLGIVYIAQGAEFLGLTHVFVYTGAVMMLFLFVVMLIGVDASESRIETIPGQRWLSALIVLLLAGLLISTIASVTVGPVPTIAQINAEGNVTGLAFLIFGRYLWVFQLTAALLITAALAAMVLAHRERLLPRPTQREWSVRRVRDNRFVAGLPAPGVYARHNAVDTPALLPDGTPSDLSVSRVLRAREQLLEHEQFSEGEVESTREIEEGSTR